MWRRTGHGNTHGAMRGAAKSFGVPSADDVPKEYKAAFAEWKRTAK
jgi:hypothetical protein